MIATDTGFMPREPLRFELTGEVRDASSGELARSVVQRPAAAHRDETARRVRQRHQRHTRPSADGRQRATADVRLPAAGDLSQSGDSGPPYHERFWNVVH